MHQILVFYIFIIYEYVLEMNDSYNLKKLIIFVEYNLGVGWGDFVPKARTTYAVPSKHRIFGIC